LYRNRCAAINVNNVKHIATRSLLRNSLNLRTVDDA